jgi:hypothetical protein
MWWWFAGGADIDCAILCHFLIIHGGSFGYKISYEPAKMHGRQPRSAHVEFPRHATPFAPITILFHCAYNSAQTMFMV